MSETGAPAGGQGAQGGGVPLNLLQGSKLTDALLQGQPAPDAPGQGQQFTKPPKSVSEAQAAAEGAADEGPINVQQASVEEALGEMAGDAGALEVLPEGKGQKEQPYALTDLPEDRFVEIQVDGAKEVVSLRELASGHIRRKAFNKFTNQAKSAIAEARQYAETAVGERRAIRESLQNFLSDPAKMLEFMLEQQPQVAEQFARGYAQIWDGWQKNPEARRRYEWEREQKKLAADRRKLDEERTQHEKKTSEERAAAQEMSRLKPMYQRTMREIGFPKVTPKFRETVNILCEAARRSNGGQLDPEDLRDAIHAAHKYHPAEGTVQERRPQPVTATPKPAAPPRRPNGQFRDWSAVPYNKRMSDPDFFLRK